MKSNKNVLFDKEYVKIDENQKKHTDELLVVIDELLKSANFKIEDISIEDITKELYEKH